MGTVGINERIMQIAKNADLRRVKSAKGSEIPQQDKSPSITSTGRLQSMADANNRLRKQNKAILTEYSENRRRAGQLREEIAIGSRNGDDLQILFDKAVKCISLMTGDTAFYTTVTKNTKNK